MKHKWYIHINGVKSFGNIYILNKYLFNNYQDFLYRSKLTFPFLPHVLFTVPKSVKVPDE